MIVLLKRHYPKHCPDYESLTICEALSFTIDVEDGSRVIEVQTNIGLNYTQVTKKIRNEGVKDLDCD